MMISALVIYIAAGLVVSSVVRYALDERMSVLFWLFCILIWPIMALILFLSALDNIKI